MSALEPCTVDDLYRHRVISGLAGGRGHSWLVFQVEQARRKTDDYRRRIWGLDTSRDERARPLTLARFDARSPMLDSRADTLAFVSTRGKHGARIHLLPMGGGEARALTGACDRRIKTIEAWSPDDSRLLVCASVPWIEDGEEPPKDGSRAPEVVRHLPYKRDGTGIIVGRRTHLFDVDASSGKLVALTDGDFDVEQGRWSTDGRRLAFVRNRTERQRHVSDLWIADGDGGNARILDDSMASIGVIAWSPDDRWLAVAASEVQGDSRVELWLVDTSSGERRRLGEPELELVPGTGLAWNESGDRLAVIASRRGLHVLTVVSVQQGVATSLDTDLRHTLGISPCGPHLAFVAASMRRPCEVYSDHWQGGQERRLTRFNRKWVDLRRKPRVSKRRFCVPDGAGGVEWIEGWLLRPSEGDGPFPLLVDMHGGPHSMVLIDFAAHTYWYELCSRGWAILAPNAVGSSGYGRRFARRLRGRWGELDLPQFEAAVRHLQACGLADDRVACCGKSYGGFLGAWAIGHSRLFRSAVVCAPVANMVSHAGTSDTGYYVTPFLLDAEPDEDPERYARLSPIGECRRATAATLILQGENDGRCPRGQSEELFSKLVRCSSAVVEMVIYPGSTHAEAESGKPSHRRDYHGRIVDWVSRRTTGTPAPA